MPREPNHLDLKPHGSGLHVACELAQACVGLCEGVLGLSPRGSKTRTLLRLVSVWLTALLGFVCPLVPTACPFGQVPPPLRSLTSPHGDRPWGGGCRVERDMIGEERAIRAQGHLASQREP